MCVEYNFGSLVCTQKVMGYGCSTLDKQGAQSERLEQMCSFVKEHKDIKVLYTLLRVSTIRDNTASLKLDL